MGKWLRGVALVLLCRAQGALAGTVLVVGDSISAAFGLETSQGWVQLLQERLDSHAPDYKVVNASISGDTTAGGRSRLPGLLSEHDPDVVILELGGNDGLRGQSPVQLKQNLAAMTEMSQEAGAEVLILGMLMPPNLGRRYTEAFAKVFPEVASEHDVPLVPFLLEGVAGVPSMMQGDQIHPTAEAQSKLLDNVWPALEPLL